MNKSILRILKLAQKGKEGHVPSSLSILDIIETLYKKFITKKKFDKFFLSKGHGSLALYVVLEKYKITKNLESFCSFNSNFGGHPDKNKIKGVESSTGSLGHGFPFASGIALAKKIAKELKVPFINKKDKKINQGAPNHVQIDIDKYKKEFGNFKFTDIKKGLNKTIEWHNKIIKK